MGMGNTDPGEFSSSHRTHTFLPEETEPTLKLQGQPVAQNAKQQGPSDNKSSHVLSHSKADDLVNNLILNYTISQRLARAVTARRSKGAAGPLTGSLNLGEYESSPASPSSRAGTAGQQNKTKTKQSHELSNQFLEAHIGQYLAPGTSFAGSRALKGAASNPSPHTAYEQYSTRLDSTPAVRTFYLRPENRCIPPKTSTPPQPKPSDKIQLPGTASLEGTKKLPRVTATEPRVLANGVPMACLDHLHDLGSRGGLGKTLKLPERMALAEVQGKALADATSKTLDVILDRVLRQQAKATKVEGGNGGSTGQPVYDAEFCKSIQKDLEKMSLEDAHKMQSHLNYSLPDILDAMHTTNTL